MKNLTTLFFLIGLSFFIKAQEANKNQKDRANMFSTYITEKLDLSEEQESFVHNVMLERVVNAAKKINAKKGMSQDDKRFIYQAEYKNSLAKLTSEYGPKMARQIMAAANEARKEMVKN